MTSFRLIGVLHLPPLPGAANYAGRPVRDIADGAAAGAAALERAGFTDVMIQDASDRPQRTVLTSPGIAALASVGTAVASATSLTLGVVAGHNDGPGGVAVAHAVGARFVRVKVLTGAAVGPEGLLEGCAVATADMRRLLGSDVEIWADVHEATSLPLVGTQAWAGTEAVKFGGADALVVTSDDGVQQAVDRIAALRATLPRPVPLIIGGRVTVATAALAASGSDGAIIGGALNTPHGIDEARAAEIAAAARLPVAVR